VFITHRLHIVYAATYSIFNLLMFFLTSPIKYNCWLYYN